MSTIEDELREFLYDIRVELEVWRSNIENESDGMSREVLLELYADLIKKCDLLTEHYTK